MRDFLIALGVDMQASDLLRTPERVAQLWGQELLVRDAFLASDYFKHRVTLPGGVAHPMMALTPLNAFSVCPHHLLPYSLKIHIAWIPREYTIGFSVAAQIIETLCRRMILVENLMSDIVDALMMILAPHGVACKIESQQSCMIFRAEARPESHVNLAAYRGVFEEDSALRQEFNALMA